MTHYFLRRRPITVVTALALALLLAPLAGTASAQYGGGGNLLVDPVQVPVDGTFSYLGSACPPDSTVTITIDGFTDILDTTVADGDSDYVGFDSPVPEGLVPGQQYDVRASCASFSYDFTITAVCSNGDSSTDGECGGTLGGVPTTTTTQPTTSTTTATTTTTTTTVPSTTTVPGDGGNLTGTVPDDAPGDLAITGATYAQIAMQAAVTLIALGGLLLLATTKRRNAESG